MSTLLNSLQREVTVALKSGDRVRVDTLRFLLSAVRNSAIAKYANVGEAGLTDRDVLDVIAKQVKTHRESVEAFTKAGRTELADREASQLAILEAYLPKQMTDADLKKLLEPIASSGEKNFGLLMGQAMNVVKGQADGQRVSAILKRMTNQ